MKKKRLIVTIASLVLVVFATVAAVVGVLAASQQNVTSTLTVSYAAVNVKARVVCEYKLQNGSWTGLNPSEGITFSPTQGTQNASFTAQSVTLGGNGQSGSDYRFNRYVIFRFTVSNTYESAQEGRSMNAVMSYTQPSAANDRKNVIIAWAQSNSATPGNISLEDSDTAWKAADTAYSTTLSTSITNASIAQNTTKYFYMVVAIADVDLDSAFNNASVSFTLTAVA